MVIGVFLEGGGDDANPAFSALMAQPRRAKEKRH